jgi:uncharacterized membrane protein
MITKEEYDKKQKQLRLMAILAPITIALSIVVLGIFVIIFIIVVIVLWFVVFKKKFEGIDLFKTYEQMYPPTEAFRRRYFRGIN